MMKKVNLNSEEFVPSKVICVGRNFAEHIREMGGADIPAEPTIFIKPNSAISFGDSSVFIPECLGLLHHEVELCCLIGRTCKDTDDDGAASAISGYAVGLDLTLRDRQLASKKEGGTWDLAKGFDGSTPIGGFVPSNAVPDPSDLDISLRVNGELKQNGNTSYMIFSPPRIISFVSHFMTIEVGDIIMCGTPEGVGPLADGDRLLAEIAGLPKLSIDIRRRA